MSHVFPSTRQIIYDEKPNQAKPSPSVPPLLPRTSDGYPRRPRNSGFVRQRGRGRTGGNTRTKREKRLATKGIGRKGAPSLSAAGSLQNRAAREDSTALTRQTCERTGGGGVDGGDGGTNSHKSSPKKEDGCKRQPRLCVSERDPLPIPAGPRRLFPSWRPERASPTPRDRASPALTAASRRRSPRIPVSAARPAAGAPPPPGAAPCSSARPPAGPGHPRGLNGSLPSGQGRESGAGKGQPQWGKRGGAGGTDENGKRAQRCPRRGHCGALHDP